MKLRVPIFVLLGATVVAGTALAAKDSPNPKDAKELAEALAGRSAGAPVDCMPNLHGTGRMEVINDDTILFRSGGTLYLQNPRGGCPGIKNGQYTLVIRQVGAHQVCRGDIHQLVDLRTGVHGGACVFGPFVPYRKTN
ncbi:MAG TPA: hypothetical protein VNJ05_00705 [Sphingomicrobium sp.]|nr:hypothetical protein [Sphingomicrobium sp.]